MEPEELERAKAEIRKRREAELREKVTGTRAPGMAEKRVPTDGSDDEDADFKFNMGGQTAESMKLNTKQLEAAQKKLEAALKDKSWGPNAFAEKARASIERALSQKVGPEEAKAKAQAAYDKILADARPRRRARERGAMTRVPRRRPRGPPRTRRPPSYERKHLCGRLPAVELEGLSRSVLGGGFSRSGLGAHLGAVRVDGLGHGDGQHDGGFALDGRVDAGLELVLPREVGVTEPDARCEDERAVARVDVVVRPWRSVDVGEVAARLAVGHAEEGDGERGVRVAVVEEFQVALAVELLGHVDEGDVAAFTDDPIAEPLVV